MEAELSTARETIRQLSAAADASAATMESLRLRHVATVDELDEIERILAVRENRIRSLGNYIAARDTRKKT